jgi:heme/copper-type cytochrome/quinol oxidase subunit 2
MSQSVSEAIFWIAVALCVVAQVAIVRSALVARVPDASGAVPVSRRPLEVLWAVVPAIALALVLLQTWRAMHSSEAAAPRVTVAETSLLPPRR